jgi:hypothetical protein
MRFPSLMLLALLGGVPLALEARALQVLPYQELFTRSVLIVVATPISPTVDTSEEYVLPGIATSDPNGTTSGVRCIGVETAFKISAVLKGDRTIRQLIFHHYRDSSAPKVNGAMLVRFDASPSSYLLFLVKEPDGRYAPTGGQVDPGFNAITKLPQVDPGLR